MITRILKGLEDIIDVYQVYLVMGPDGWFFNGEGGSLKEDPLHGFKKLKELYQHADPSYTGRYTVPVLWDKKTDTMVNNESSEIIRMFYTEFDHLLPEHTGGKQALGRIVPRISPERHRCDERVGL